MRWSIGSALRKVKPRPSKRIGSGASERIVRPVRSVTLSCNVAGSRWTAIAWVAKPSGVALTPTL